MLFDGRRCGEGVTYNTMYTHIRKAYEKNGIEHPKKTHAGRKRGAMDLKSGGYVKDESHVL